MYNRSATEIENCKHIRMPIISGYKALMSYYRASIMSAGVCDEGLGLSFSTNQPARNKLLCLLLMHTDRKQSPAVGCSSYFLLRMCDADVLKAIVSPHLWCFVAWSHVVKGTELI